MSTKQIGFAAVASMALTGCGGSSGGGSGTLNLAITDSPVDGVEQVVVEFTGVSLKPRGGDEFDVVFDEPLTVDLRTLNSGNTAMLLDGEVVPAGAYDWIRLHVNAEFDSVLDSYVVEDGGGQVELRVPSGANRGLRLVS